jgi:hypothetical protein
MNREEGVTKGGGGGGGEATVTKGKKKEKHKHKVNQAKPNQTTPKKRWRANNSFKEAKTPAWCKPPLQHHQCASQTSWAGENAAPKCH